MKHSVAIVRGKFLNAYEMQFYEPLTNSYDITAFGSRFPFHDNFSFPVKKLYSPMDWPTFPFSLSLYNRLFTDAQLLFGLENELKGFDLVHTAETYYRYTQQCLHAKKKGYVKKVIATVLENIPFNNEGIYGRSQYKKRSRNELDHIIALTQRTKTALLIEGADEKKISVVPHFIDTKRFTPAKIEKKETIIILFCGRLERYKGVYELLWSAYLLKHDPSLTKKLNIVFAGNGSEREQMKHMIKTLHIQDIVDFVSVEYKDMPELYKKADIYAAPSKSNGTWIEQYNTTLLEAQASGLPIVTTYSGGIPENVGNAAVLVPPDDTYALANAIKDFILHPDKRAHYGALARSRAEEKHDISIGASLISAVWDRVLRS